MYVHRAGGRGRMETRAQSWGEGSHGNTCTELGGGVAWKHVHRAGGRGRMETGYF